jgi:hypothetical protein
MNGSIRSRPGDDRAGNRYSAEPARADLFHRFRPGARVDWRRDERHFRAGGGLRSPKHESLR